MAVARKHDQTGRSKGEGRHVRLYHWLIKSTAWKHLGALERAVYVEIVMRYAGEGSNNGRLAYSVREAADSFRVSKATASRALRRLEEIGFIACVIKGGFNRKNRHATEWRLTEFRCDVTGDMASKDFMRWQPTVISTKPKKQNAVSVMKPTVPPVKPSGISSETVTHERALDGPLGDTAKAEIHSSSVSPEGHMYIYQGGEPTEKSSHLSPIKDKLASQLFLKPGANQLSAARLLETPFLKRTPSRGQ